jgi:outer membrane protein assembly factor BamE
MKRLALPTIFLACGAILASGCVYKMSIQQGNYLVTDSVSQLKEGMTRSQVRFLLGTPMVPDAFDDSRWDYYYFYSSRKFDQPLKRRLTVYFADERVQRVENQGVPTQTDLDQLEQDLRKAINAKKQAKKQQGQPEPEPEAKTSDDAGQPNPVPSSQPLPVPSGSSSDRP